MSMKRPNNAGGLTTAVNRAWLQKLQMQAEKKGSHAWGLREKLCEEFKKCLLSIPNRGKFQKIRRRALEKMTLTQLRLRRAEPMLDYHAREKGLRKFRILGPGGSKQTYIAAILPVELEQYDRTKAAIRRKAKKAALRKANTDGAVNKSSGDAASAKMAMKTNAKNKTSEKSTGAKMAAKPAAVEDPSDNITDREQVMKELKSLYQEELDAMTLSQLQAALHYKKEMKKTAASPAKTLPAKNAGGKKMTMKRVVKETGRK